MEQSKLLPIRIRSGLEALVGRFHNDELYAPVVEQCTGSLELHFTAIISEEFLEASLKYLAEDLNLPINGEHDTFIYRKDHKVLHIYFGQDISAIKGRTRGFYVYDLGRLHHPKYDGETEAGLACGLTCSLRTAATCLNKITYSLLMDI